MNKFNCRMCGGQLPVTTEPVVECEYCGSRQPVPSADSEKKQTLFARANRLRMDCEFDRAAAVYESIVAEFPEESEASWGIVLCRYGIEYVDDPATGKKVPTCHRSSFASILDDADYRQTLDNADPLARRLYHREAAYIEELREKILSVSANEEPYDIFICYKETDEKKNRTLDSVLAQDLYDLLTAKGYRVFFARISLEDKLGREYEPYIFAALNSAKLMLAVGTCFEHYDAVWVKNEWSRFLKLMEKNQEKYLIPCYKDIDAYDIPKEFRKLQAQDLGKVGAHQDLLRGIEKLMGSAQTVATAVQVVNPEVSALVMRGRFALEDRDFVKAAEYFERALDQNPQDSYAYLGKVLAAYRLTKEDHLEFYYGIVRDNKDFLRAFQFAEGKLKQQLLTIQNNALKKHLGCQIISILNQVKKTAKKQEELQEKYEMALQYMENACSSVAYTIASERFKKLGNYQDSDHYAALCVKKAEEINLQQRYTEARKCMKIGNFATALTYFTSLGDYADSDTLRRECEKHISELKRIKEEKAKADAEYKNRKQIYDKAVSMMNRGKTIGELEWALEQFDYLEDCLDVSAEKAKCRQLLTHHQRRGAGLCLYCGGKFSGFLTKKCVNCGRKKDY